MPDSLIFHVPDPVFPRPVKKQSGITATAGAEAFAAAGLTQITIQPVEFSLHQHADSVAL